MRAKRGRGVRGWDALASWYDGWVGPRGSEHHRRTAIPATMSLIEAAPAERILDVGCGQGVLAPYIHETGAIYTGVDVSRRLLRRARQRHGQLGDFVQADAAALHQHPQLRKEKFAAAIFLLSLQDMDPLEAVISSTRALLIPRGRLVILMTHPCFRIPRQSGWGWDEKRKLRYRRLDRYMTPLPVPMKSYPGASGVTTSFHRPLGAYISALVNQEFFLDALQELPAEANPQSGGRVNARFGPAEERARQEFPLFLSLRARLLV